MFLARFISDVKISPVESLNNFNSDILFLFTSNPTTSLRFFPNSIANGKPTYPSPMIDNLVFFKFI